MRAGAKVRVFAETLSDDFRHIAVQGGFMHVARAITLEDIRDCALIFSALGRPAADREAGSLAEQARVPINVADAPELCDFIMPSVVDRDPLVIAISNGGASPVFAR